MMNIPEFVQGGAFNWTAAGYHYTLHPKERQIIESDEPGDDPWFEIARVVERAKRGDFTQAGSLARFFDQDLATNAAPAAMLITGDLGRKKDIESLVKVLQDGPDGFRVYACQAARNAGYIWLVPHMLEAWHLCESVHAHEAIGFSIADLLDPIGRLDEEGDIGSRSGRFTVPTGRKPPSSKLEQLAVASTDPDASREFNELVLRRYREVLDSCPNDQATIWAGKVMGVLAFAEHFLAMISDDSFTVRQSPLTVSMREKFEAATGVNCANFYYHGKFMQLAAAATIESFLESTSPERFELSQRYFFGHRIID